MDKKISYKIRTKFDPNEILIEGLICRMKLYNSKNEEIAETIFDIQHIKKIGALKWYLCKTGYATNLKTRKRMHQLILPCPRGVEVDHKDRNKLNNKRNNLRYASKSQQGQNRGPNRNSQSGIKGVWELPNGKWSSQITCNKKRYVLGDFLTKEEAAQAYNEKALLLFGKFASVNKEGGHNE